ncbi:MAG: response regulator transcription factor [Porphyromonadaceae bacterium]|nr:response regulator transcription factor [Porphyromonadaceae bacterium]
MESPKILVVDDEESLCEILQFNLEVEGFQVDVAYSAEEVLQKELTSYSLILLDVMMGEISGFKLARQLKSQPETASIPLIFCTAKDSKDDTVMGLDLGADDYIAKPFSIREVIARVKSVLRRSTPPHKEPEGESVRFKGLELNLQRKSCRVDGREVRLTKTEFELLSLFLRNRETIFSRADILSRVWSDDVIVVDRTIDVNITRLRKKMEPYGKHIVTRLGYGYGFEE